MIPSNSKTALSKRPPSKVVIPIGIGIPSRRPVAQFVPTELLPVGGRPLIDLAIEEALASGIREVILVTPDSSAMVEAFLHSAMADSKGRGEAAGVDWNGQILITRHGDQGSLGRAIVSARPMIGPEPFAVLVPTDLVFAGTPAMSQLIACYGKDGGNVVGVMADGRSDSPRGFTAIAEAPCGRYILQPDVLDALERQIDWDLAQAIVSLAEAWSLRAVDLQGHHIDAKSRSGLLEAQLADALHRGDLKEEIDQILARFGPGRAESAVAPGSHGLAVSRD